MPGLEWKFEESKDRSQYDSEWNIYWQDVQQRLTVQVDHLHPGHYYVNEYSLDEAGELQVETLATHHQLIPALDDVVARLRPAIKAGQDLRMPE